MPNSLSRTDFGIVPSHLCLVFRGIVTVSATNCAALHANLCSLAKLPRHIIFDCNDMNVLVDAKVQRICVN